MCPLLERLFRIRIGKVPFRLRPTTYIPHSALSERENSKFKFSQTFVVSVKRSSSSAQIYFHQKKTKSDLSASIFR